jgi:hypothetical protein
MSRFRLSIGDSRLEAWAVADAGPEVWVEVDLPGLAEPAQRTTKRQAAAPALDFGFVLELPAGPGSSAQEAFRAALTGGDEEDADLTFTLKAPGPRKKAKDVASGYLNLRDLLSTGEDLIQATVALVGKDDSPAGFLTISLTALDALRAASSPAPAQPLDVSETEMPALASASSPPTQALGAEQARVATVAAAEAGTVVSDVVEQLNSDADEASGAARAGEAADIPAEVREVKAAESGAGAVDPRAGPAISAAGAAPGQSKTVLAGAEASGCESGDATTSGGKLPPPVPPPASAAVAAAAGVAHKPPLVPAPAAAADANADAVSPAATTACSAVAASQLGANARDGLRNAAVAPSAATTDSTTQAASAAIATPGAPVPSPAELSVLTPDAADPDGLATHTTNWDASIADASRMDASSVDASMDASRVDASRVSASLTPRARQRAEEDRAAAAGGEHTSSTARRAAARAAHKAALAALVGGGVEADAVKNGVNGGEPGEDEGDWGNQGVNDGVNGDVNEGVCEGGEFDAAGHPSLGPHNEPAASPIPPPTTSTEGPVASPPSPPPPSADDWRLGVTADEARLLLPASGRRYKLRLRVGGGEWFESRASRPSGHSHLSLSLVRSVYVGPGARAHRGLVEAVGRRRGEAGQEGIGVQAWVMEGAREEVGAAGQTNAETGWRVLAAGAMSWMKVMAQVRGVKASEGWAGAEEGKGWMGVQASLGWAGAEKAGKG